jgi:hypothetical protein
MVNEGRRRVIMTTFHHLVLRESIFMLLFICYIIIIDVILKHGAHKFKLHSLTYQSLTLQCPVPGYVCAYCQVSSVWCRGSVTTVVWCWLRTQYAVAVQIDSVYNCSAILCYVSERAVCRGALCSRSTSLRLD